MKNTHKFLEDTEIFSTGVNLKPLKVEINGKAQWRWIAVGFEDSSFSNGEEIEVYDYSDELDGLLVSSE